MGGMGNENRILKLQYYQTWSIESHDQRDREVMQALMENIEIIKS